ncbi:putative AP2/ERF family transcription factor family protein [Skeletonema marinoi]|uniref:AP2/ERF family transcription factor family protein n=1 Tax=Skeletonema marinoi TaxID=267567 RepID=A0AAD9DBQ3_9STRA|nr:putative AP2/ERF family transcription factor family protein [Skeletonema marinoi]
MVTRSVILVTASEAAAFAATSTLSSSSSSPVAAAAADSIISNAPFEQINLDEELQTNSFNYPSYSKRAQHPSPGGLVQLCRHKGCFHAVDFERRNGGLCCIHQKGPMDGEQSDSEDFSKDDAKICGGAADKNCLGEVGKKRAHLSEDSISGKNDIKRQRVDAFVLDLTGVPPQPPIPKSAGRIKEGASKYTGVSFDKKANKWEAKISIDGKQRHIGAYESEEEAAVDYARAVVKLKKQRARYTSRVDAFVLDLTGVPPQPPIPKSAGRIKEGASKYTGVSFDKKANKWEAKISIDGKQRHIGYYESEEEAAVDYACAVVKLKGQGALDKAREAKECKRDLSDIPSQLPIPKSAGCIKEGASKYTGVSFNKKANKWQAQISIAGKSRFIGYYVNEEEAAVDYARTVFKFKGQGECMKIGYYENEEEAAVDYARAVFKYKNQAALGKAREQDSFIIDLSDVPPQPPIPKSSGSIKEGALKYAGVSFNKSKNKWKAQITIEGKQRAIGSYEIEEEAGADYARAVFKYKGQGALDKAREQGARDKVREQNSFIIDLSDVPPQPPIPKRPDHIKEGASKYKSRRGPQNTLEPISTNQ